jgi:hypothetical protein
MSTDSGTENGERGATRFISSGNPVHLPNPRANRRAERTSSIRKAGGAVITGPSLSLATARR